ncbi:unnamed protein product [Urochloa humidicola]
MAADRVLLSRDDTTISTVEISRAATTTPPSAPTVGFRIVVVQCYRAVRALEDDDDDADTLEDVACRVPVDELIGDGEGEGEGGAAAVAGRAFEALVSRLDHPTLIPAVAPEARKAAACAARGGITGGGDLAGVEFRLRLVFFDPLEDESETESEEDEEEIGSDLELDDECWERGMTESDGGGDTPYEHGQFIAASDGDGESQLIGGGAWRYEHEHGDAALSDDNDEDGGGGGCQFTARPFGGAMAREGGPSDGTLLLSGYTMKE